MTYPSQTPEMKRLRKRKHDQRKAEQLRQVNERLSAIGIDHNELLRLIVEDRVRIQVIKESER